MHALTICCWPQNPGTALEMTGCQWVPHLCLRPSQPHSDSVPSGGVCRAVTPGAGSLVCQATW